MENLIQDLYDAAYNAYRNISFDPERRAKQTVEEYGNHLNELMKIIPVESKQKFIEGYRSKLKNWLYARSRCASTMITGPANFNVRRNEKANNSERKRYEEFKHYYESWIKNIQRAERKANEPQRDHKEPVIVNFEGGQVIVNYDMDRVQIKHDTKPDADTLQKIKDNAFRWSPSNKVWQRQLTINGLYATMRVTNANLNGIKIK